MCFCYGKSTKTICPNKAVPPLLNNTANPGKVVDCHPNIPDVARRDAFAGFAGIVQFTATLPAVWAGQPADDQ